MYVYLHASGYVITCRIIFDEIDKTWRQVLRPLLEHNKTIVVNGLQEFEDEHTFFPFDKYNLPHSRHFIDPIYQVCVCVCVCVCIYICVCVCVFVFVCAHVYAYVFARESARGRAWMRV